MKAERNIVHDGAVERIAGDTVYVRIAARRRAAAAGPARPAARRVRASASSPCGLRPGYAPGDAVRVGVTRTVRRPCAVLLAYGGSLGVLLVVLAALHGPAATTTVRRPWGRSQPWAFTSGCCGCCGGGLNKRFISQ